MKDSQQFLSVKALRRKRYKKYILRSAFVICLLPIISLAVIFLTPGRLGYHMRHWIHHLDMNNACVERAVAAYEVELKNHNYFKYLQDLSAPQAQKYSRNLNKILQGMTMKKRSATSLRERIHDIDDSRKAFAEVFPPMTIRQNKDQTYIYPYAGPNPLPIPTPIQNNQSGILDKAVSVGRLEVRPSDKTGDAPDPVFWGTGFVVASDLIATTCHVIDPLTTIKDGKPTLDLDGQDLVIDFELNRNSHDKSKECRIKEIATCSARAGADIALLQIDSDKCKVQLPPPLKLYTGDVNTLINDKDDLVILGYPDLDHEIDKETDELYKPYLQLDDAKFVLLDSILSIDKCDDELNIFLDLASTAVGESGSVLLDISPKDATRQFTVVGMHTCCSTFFADEPGIPPEPETACARVRRTFANQAISSRSILNDPKVCNTLKNHGVAEAQHCPH